MSSGATASEYPMASYGKNGPPWQRVSKQENKKKFNYKNRTNKIPLRDKLRQAEEERLFQEAEREAKLRANKMLAERRQREQDIKSSCSKQSTTGILKNNKSTSNEILKDGKSGSQTNYVTLTQDQLSTILQTLSKVQGKSNDVQLDVEDKDHLKLTLDRTDSSLPVSRESGQSVTSTTQQLESVLNLSKKVKTSNGTSDAIANSVDNISTDRRESHKKKPSKQVIMNFNLSGDATDNPSRSQKKAKSVTKAKKQVKIANDLSDKEEPVFVRRAAKVVVVEDEKPENNSSAAIPTTTTSEIVQDKQFPPQEQSGPVELSPRQKQLLIPRAHMTIGERKRLQWELENAAIEKLKKENEERAQRLGVGLSARKTTQTEKSVEENKANTKKTDTLAEPKTREQLREAVVFVEPDFVPGLGDLTSNASTSKADQIKSQKPSTTTTVPPILTKAEQKRLQWNKERADAPEEYNPWGRPGVGVGPKAPPTKDLNNVGPVANRKQLLTSEEQIKQQLSEQKGSRYEKSSQPSEDMSANSLTAKKYKPSQPNANQLRGPFQEPINGVPTSLLGVENPPRDILKAPTSQTTPEVLSKAQLLKMRWAQEKALAEQEYNPFGKPGAGAPIRSDSGTVLTSYHSRQKHMLRKSVEEHQAQQQETNQSETRAAIPSTEQPDSVPGLNLNTVDANTEETTTARNHIRGQLVNLDPATIKEREELRRKELRYQEEIRQQVEEKQRLKQEERLRKLKEEAEEEAKFRAERSSQQQESEHTRHMKKIKREEPKVYAKDLNLDDQLANSIKRAAQEAEILKAKKRLEKLQAAGHDITHLKAAYEEKFSPRVGPIISEILTPRKDTDSQSKDILSPRAFNSQSHNQQTVEPTSVPGLDLSPRGPATRQGDNTSRTARSNAGGYISNRVITPHKWQGTQKENHSPMKEFGVQTDTPPPTQKSTRQQKAKPQANNTNVNGSNKKHVRVISGPKTRKTKEPQEPKPWGWKNQGGKKFTAQSKRDPHFEEKQEQKIVRTQARKDQLLRQVEANSKHIPDGKSTRSSVEMTNRDRETVNSYLSPRHRLSNSPPPLEQHSKQRKPSEHLNSERTHNPNAVKPTNSKAVSSGDRKNSDTLKTKAMATGYEPSIANILSISPDDEYVPFRRSDAVLSPSNAQEPSPMSREHTQVAMAREAYYKSMKPAQYGVHMHNIKDNHQPSQPISTQPVTSHSKDPLYNPSVITKHPTDRQQQVLESLRQMRQGLMAKRREIESVVSPDSALHSHY